jgi:hypothetical protein
MVCFHEDTVCDRLWRRSTVSAGPESASGSGRLRATQKCFGINAGMEGFEL